MASDCIRAARTPVPLAIIIALSLASGTFADHQNLTTGVNVHHHNTSLGKMTFATEPEGRGTWSIIFSCTVTLLFCVWTAMHPDIVPGLSSWYRFFYRMLLMLIAAVNPEAIAVLAWQQWRDARRIRKEWNDHFQSIQDDASEDLGMETAFFVVMGGFLIDRSEVKSNKRTKQKHTGRFYTHNLHETNEKRVPGRFIATVTPTGFVKYLKDGLFDDFQEPVFEKKDILDKSKAYYLGKVLSAFQALWLLVQYFQRCRSKLVITSVPPPPPPPNLVRDAH